MSDFGGEPSGIVAGCVNAITGNFVVKRDDLVVRGQQPIRIPIRYSQECVDDSYEMYGGWDFGERYLEIVMGRLGDLYVPEKSGLRLKYFYSDFNIKKAWAKGKKIVPLDLSGGKEGWVNTSLGKISARFNPLNNVVYAKHGDLKEIIVEGPDGVTRYYRTKRSMQRVRYGPNFRDTVNFLLRAEVFPNGNGIVYHWKELRDKRWKVVKIESKSPSGKVYAWVKIDYEPKDDAHRKRLVFTTSDGRTVQYKFDSKFELEEERIALFKEVEYSYKPDEKYEYWKSSKKWSYPNWCELPDGRKLNIHYNHTGYNSDTGITIHKKHALGDLRYTRVGSIYQPMGENGELTRTHMLRYSPGKYKIGNGSTDAFDAYGNLTRYDYNSDFLLTKIKRHTQGDKLFSTEVFNWTDKNWLKNKAFLDEEGKAQFAFVYRYDDKGNITDEYHTGDLHGHHLVVETENPSPENAYHIKKEYYSNNLLKKESDPSGKVITYHYEGNSDLLRAQFIDDKNNHHRKRLFYLYDDSVRVCEITDNGTGDDQNDLTGVTERHIKRITPNPPGFMCGVPHVIEEKYLDLETSEEILLSKEVLHYEEKDHGHVSSIDHYDAAGQHRFTLTYAYDDKDRLITQTDPLGRVRTIDYDENYNPISDDDPNENVQLGQSYDKVNRIVKSWQEAPSGENQSVTWRYNNLSQKVEEEDFRGNVTRHEYDPFNHPTKTLFPNRIDESGNTKTPEVTRTFNSLGALTSEKDPEGNITKTLCNARGKPYQVTYPDGAVESFSYDQSGYHIVTKISAEGVQTKFTYDAFDRVIQTSIYSVDNELISQEKFTYDAYKLLSKEDPDGVVTTYIYDGAGRKIREETLGRIVTFTYDPLGRVEKVSRFCDGEALQVFFKEYDLLGRVLEERQEDSHGEIYAFERFEYDDFSNKIALKKEVQVGESVEQFFYDPFRRLVKQIDPLGHTTTLEYEDDFQNGYGQTVLRKTTTDPMGRKTIETYDVFDNLSTLEKQNASGKTLLHEAFFYNLNQKKIKQVSTLFDPDKRIVKTWDYDARSRLKELREAVGENIEKVTQFAYTPDNHLKEMIKPDGTVVTYTYDGLGRQIAIETSDGSCHYKLKHNKMGHVIESKDCITGKVTQRVYNHFGELLEETLANMQSLKRSYDDLGRRAALIFADGSMIEYDYDPYHLTQIERISKSGASLYVHSYTEYDRSFNLTKECLISDEVVYHFIDLKGRRIETDTPYSNEKIPVIDPCGNVLNYERTFNGAIETSKFKYDDLNQLISEEGLFHHNYAYDSHHNRLQKNETAYELNALHELTATSNTAYKHDLNGNRTFADKEKASIEYSYDGLDRLIQIRSGDLAIRFAYDSWSRCLSAQYFQIEDGAFIFQRGEDYLYDEQNELGAYPHQIRILGQGKGAEIGATIAIEQDRTIYIPVHDLFGNIIALLDPKTHEAKASYRYTVFGEEQISNASVHNPWRFQSKRSIGQLVSFGRRFYDPETGRWLSPDPKGFDEGPNLYQFLLNCPMLYSDLYGEAIKKLPNVAAMEEHLTFDNDFENRFGGPYSKNWTYVPDKDYSGLLDHPLITREKEIGFIGGINNTFDEHKKNVMLMSKYAGDMPIRSTYNATHKVVNDLKEAKMGLNLVGTQPARLAYERKLQFFLNTSPNSVYMEVDHSQGNIHGAISQLLLPEEYRRRTVLVGIASALFSPKELWKEAFFYHSTKDPVPRLQKFIGKIPIETQNATAIEPGKGEGSCHSFSSEIYRPFIEDHVKRYLRGEYD